ncbi:LacI family DNA-binding transcriptional regulator [Aureimonas sp. AU4]|uniref:LacI family DNA-binding transcriptional regulator n=1 Tax=Aureimonas sp. AU4 TaxID=1638163 RepID=UPI000780B89D|nr:LacI family DNA-binding transcriptional regulator [Aureimonas sp. AU4]
MKKSTMRDVSRVTGLSMFTVSRALSGADGVSDESRLQVRRAADELGYIPNRAAQDLRKTSRDSVAVITASTSNSYYLDLMSGVQKALRPADWTVVMADVAVDGVYDAITEERTVRRLIETRTAGVISTLTLKPASVSLLSRWDIPIVFVDSAPPKGRVACPSVTTDNYAASREVGRHLAGHGYADWLFLAYPARWSTRFERERGIREAAEAHGIRLEVLESGNDPESAHKVMAARLAAGGPLPRALIAGNNPLLLGALRLLRERGLHVPDDVAVVGFDEFAWAGLTDPPLTVLNERSEEIGHRAALMLARIIEAQGEAERRGQSAHPVYRDEDVQQVEPELVIRRSCGC